MSAREELSALDQLFWDMEGPETHMAVGSVAIFTGPTPDRAEVEDAFERRLDLVPRLRQRVVEIPLGLGRPVWIDDPGFDLRHHLGSENADGDLNATVARLISRPLDRSRPLWEVCLVDGLRGGGFALVSKTHHCLLDGVAGADVLAVMLDPSAEVAPGPRSAWRPSPPPRPEDLAREAVHRLLRSPAAAGRALETLTERPAEVIGRVAEKVGAAADFLGDSFSAPPSSLNRRIGPHRRFETVSAGLAELKSATKEFGATVNDAVLAVVTGGLRRLLAARGEPVDDMTLRAGVPVSLRRPGEAPTLGNRIASLWPSLPVYEADPFARLTQIHEEMSRLKGSDRAAGADALVRLGRWAPPALVAQVGRLLERQRACNLVVTNIPGPAQPLFCLGREMTELYPIVPLNTNATVAAGVFSYNGRLGFGLVGDRDGAPDLALLAEGIEKSLAELIGL
jgi:diacylglycerol O-acyltransferase / wax synthase